MYVVITLLYGVTVCLIQRKDTGIDADVYKKQRVIQQPSQNS